MKVCKAVSQLPRATEDGKKDFFDPEKEEEQALQNLVDKLSDRVEKEVSSSTRR